MVSLTRHYLFYVLPVNNTALEVSCSLFLAVRPLLQHQETLLQHPHQLHRGLGSLAEERHLVDEVQRTAVPDTCQQTGHVWIGHVVRTPDTLSLVLTL